MLSARQLCITGALLGALGVMAGAFGTHYLDAWLTPEAIATFKTGTSYMQLHALLMLFIGASVFKWDISLLKRAGTMCLVGIILFSGSVMVLALTGLRWLGALAPVGGFALILSWILVAVSFARISKVRERA